MSVKPRIELTADGSHTLFVPELDEHYHSVNGAIQESNHVFIEAGLNHCPKDKIHIFEVGFGTGLNAFLSLNNSIKMQKAIHYTTIEAFPLPFSTIEKLNYADNLSLVVKDMFHQIHKAEWGKEVSVHRGFFLKKIEGDLIRFDFSLVTTPVDIIYFDAFAPDKQSDMWTQEIFDKLYTITADNGTLVTYCAKGEVRRMMQRAGYKTERLPGPPGKREMLRATKII